MKKTIICLLMSLVALFAWACSNGQQKAQGEKTAENAEVAELSGPYLGQKTPGETPEIFAPGILTTGLHDDGAPRFSEDLKEMYFRKWAIPHDIIAVMREIGGKWTKPELFKPAGEYVVINPIFIPGTNKALFDSRMPVPGKTETADFNAWIAEKTDDGWTELKFVKELSIEGKDLNVWSASADGTVYLQGNLDDSIGQYDFYVSRLVDGRYEKPVNMGAPVNTEKVEAAPFISADGSYLLYCAVGYEDGQGSTDLYVAFRKDDGSWTRGYNLGDKVNTKHSEKFPSISPDGKYFFFVGAATAERQFKYSDLSYEEIMKQNLAGQNGLGGDVYWCSTSVIEKLRKVALK